MVRRQGVTVRADLEDNFHRFGVDLTLSPVTRQIIEAEGRSGRVPWVTCGEAAAALDDFLDHDTSQPFILDGRDGSRHCTHLFDLALLVLDHVRLSLPDRDYQISVEGPVECETARLSIDGTLRLCWRVAGDVIDEPADWRARSLKAMKQWGLLELAERDLMEALLLRRAIHISHGRFIDQDAWRAASDLGARPTCHSFRPDVSPRALRVVGSMRDFTDDPRQLLADVRRGE